MLGCEWRVKLIEVNGKELHRPWINANECVLYCNDIKERAESRERRERTKKRWVSSAPGCLPTVAVGREVWH